MDIQRSPTARDISLELERRNSVDKDHSLLVWKRISDAALKEIGGVPRDLEALWKLCLRQNEAGAVEEDNEYDYLTGEDSEDEDYFLDEKEATTLEELKVKAIPLADKKRKLGSLPNVSDQTNLGSFQNYLSGFRESSNKGEATKKQFLSTTLWSIQAEFGSSVLSFFNFLHWTIFLNIFNSLLVLLLVIAPQISWDKLATSQVLDEDVKCRHVDFNNTKWFPRDNISECCSKVYETELERKQYNFTTGEFFTNLGQVLVSLLQGTRSLEGSPMFYGYYDGTFVFEYKTVKFDFPLAFFSVMLILMLVNLVIIVVSSAKSFYKSLEEGVDQTGTISNLIFGRYDFGMNTEKSVQIQKTDIISNLKLALSKGTTKVVSRKLWVLRFFIHALTFAILGGFLFLIYIVTTYQPKWMMDQQCLIEDDTSVDAITNFKCFVLEYLPSITVTGGNMIFPFMFTYLITFESYSNKNSELLLNLIRCILLRLASLIVALLSLQSTVNCDYVNGRHTHTGGIDACDSTIDVYQVCSNNVPEGLHFCNSEDDACKKPICWETYVGQQFYQLTVVDFLAQLGMVFLFDLPRSLVFGKMLEGTTRFKTLHMFAGRIEFNISKHVLDIVYTQTICWLSLFYAPLISVLTVVKCILIYFIKIFYVIYVCVPSQVPYSASRASAFFKGFLLISFTLSLLCVSLLIGIVSPSTGCGPFRNILCANDKPCLVYDYIIYSIEKIDSHTVKKILYFFGETSFLYALAGILAITAYLMWSFTHAKGALLRQMRKQLKYLKAENSQKLKSLRNDIKMNFQM